MSSACAQSGILAVGLIGCRHNAARVSMMPFPSVEIYAESMCYHCRAYAPQTRGQVIAGIQAFGMASAIRQPQLDPAILRIGVRCIAGTERLVLPKPRRGQMFR